MTAVGLAVDIADATHWTIAQRVTPLRPPCQSAIVAGSQGEHLKLILDGCDSWSSRTAQIASSNGRWRDSQPLNLSRSVSTRKQWYEVATNMVEPIVQLEESPNSNVVPHANAGSTFLIARKGE